MKNNGKSLKILPIGEKLYFTIYYQFTTNLIEYEWAISASTLTTYMCLRIVAFSYLRKKNRNKKYLKSLLFTLVVPDQTKPDT